MSDTKNEALQALADGEGYLMPVIQTLYFGARVEIDICYENKFRTRVYVDEAFSALAQSGLSRKQIEEAVKESRLYFHEEIDELLHMLDEKSQLDSLIIIEDQTDSFSF